MGGDPERDFGGTRPILKREALILGAEVGYQCSRGEEKQERQHNQKRLAGKKEICRHRNRDICGQRDVETPMLHVLLVLGHGFGRQFFDFNSAEAHLQVQIVSLRGSRA